eukprot:CAMPEP_0194203362 /NCGR_PEP_ID=MMETSP0156-20130528/3176_1 /TAXON_ID=33649 /ORGANISM="Thalassionema nitzschioides, Strain L26-B" /LENGTH=242 /DNA_ID=CAMNT_0038929105 /DNA_START=89 /DNA_END=817 /DNA_ORIENTATION=+
MMKISVIFAICIGIPFVTLAAGFVTPSGGTSMLMSRKALANHPRPLVRIPSAQYNKKQLLRLAATSSEASDDTADSEKDEEPVVVEELSRLARIKKRIFPPKEEDGLTFKQKLTKAGLSVVLSYGWVSNVSYSIAVSLAWFVFSKQTGLSPLAPQQWKKFLAVYAGFFVFNNVIRPLRFAASVGASLYFDKLVQKIQDTFSCKKGTAIFLTVFFANVVGTVVLMCSGIYLASLAAGVPVFAK